MKKLILSIAAVLALGTAQTASAANLVYNGSFEVGPKPGSFIQLNAGSTVIDGWTVLPHSVDYIGTYWAAQDGSRSIDLAGGNLGGIKQTINTVAGSTYTLSFWMPGNPAGKAVAKDLDVFISGIANPFNYTFDLNNTFTDMMWQEKVINFVANSNETTIAFKANQYGVYGPALDNVSVISATPVPEPASMALGFMSLAGLLATRKRKK